MKQLTAQQHKFVNALALGRSKREAAIDAGYSEKSAQAIASQLLARQDIKEALAIYFKREAEEVSMDRERLRQRMMRLAEASAHEIFDETWTLKPKSQVSPEVLDLVLSARSWDTPEQGRGASAKLLNPMDAIKNYLKLFPEQPQQALDLAEAAEIVGAELEELIQRLERGADDS